MSSHRGVAVTATAWRPPAVTGPRTSRVNPLSRSEGRRRSQGRPPPRPAAYAVAPVDTAGLIPVFQAVPPARRDQQLRLPVVIAAPFLFGHVLHDRRAAAGVRPHAHGRPRP